MIGCSKDYLIKFLESKFYDHPVTGEQMNWKNYGKFIIGGKKKWEIDHIKPYTAFKDQDLDDIAIQKIINHYSNLQPMWAEENRSKGGKFSKNNK